MNKRILEATREALGMVQEPRFYKTERGYQGRFCSALQEALSRRDHLNGGRILEQEHQKGIRHGTSQRPDIILHVPTEHSGGSVKRNNIAVWALKRQASEREAKEDFEKLDEMLETLHYRLAVFVNIDSDRHWRDTYAGDHGESLWAFAVKLSDEELTIHEG